MTDLERARESDAWICPKCGLYGTESTHDSHVCIDDGPDDEACNAPSPKALLAAARREGAEAEREKVTMWMIMRSIATGHGDTTEDLLAELCASAAAEMRERLIAALRNECERDQSFIDLAGPDDWERVMRALPLTPEEPI